MESLKPADQLSLSGVQRDTRHCLTEIYQRDSLVLYWETLKDAKISIGVLTLLSHGDLERAKRYREDYNYKIATASSRRSFTLKIKPRCRQFTTHHLRRLIGDMQLAGLDDAIVAAVLDCGGIREIAKGGPQGDESPEMVRGIDWEPYDNDFDKTGEDLEQIKASKWWRDRMEITPMTWGTLSACPRLRELHVREVALSEGCDCQMMDRLRILRVSRLITTGDKPALLARLKPCESILFDLPPELVRLELNEIWGLNKGSLTYLYDVGAWQNRRRPPALEELVIRDCRLIFGLPEIDLDKLRCPHLLTTVDLSGSQFGDVRGAHTLENLRQLDLRGNRFMRTVSDRIIR
eukprot:TRINITY_DN2936_c0_g1_i5.p1 TRINITY_DN2936_c0_g1~~TRINITY_DN2936_c0_g1_i5.p1  ORF type:complete len:349 (+),score=47.34 TRINITY_DN2936_c0_g1_i5:1098-2144(+)